MNNWQGYEMDSSQFLPAEKESRILLPLFKREKLTKKEIPKINASEFDKPIVEINKVMNKDLLKKKKILNLNKMQKHLHKTKTADKHKDLVDVIKRGLSDLENEIEGMSENKMIYETGIDIINELISNLEKILDFNNRTQEWQGFKVLTPDQMLNRLPITVAQLKAGNNSGNRKNKKWQLSCSLYY